MNKTVKKKKVASKSSQKRKKASFSDAIRAFLLVGILVALSAGISLAIIMIHSGFNNKIDDIQDIIFEDEIINNTTVEPDIEPDTKTTPTVSTTVGTNTATNTTTTSNTIAQIPVEHKGYLVFVIDDAGNNLRELEPFLNIPGPLTIAVLPGLPYSAEAAKRIRAAGKEVILHQPMEAIGAQDPGPGAIYTGMSAEEIRSILRRNIAEIGPVVGMNNHQGSKVTMDSDVMRIILEFCKDNGIYFLDSRTTADSAAPVVARQVGIKIAERNIFIDNEQNKEAMLRYISNGLTRAQRNGSAIFIGHTWSPDLAPLLTEQFALYKEQGYTILTVSDILKR
ncbi:MAG: divergent polysaccharide deacetylase family protein [Treponema sp.]|nr:divergent polysaccharide deacetylase family protein [Treponema sp.]